MTADVALVVPSVNGQTSHRWTKSNYLPPRLPVTRQIRCLARQPVPWYALDALSQFCMQFIFVRISYNHARLLVAETVFQHFAWMQKQKTCSVCLAEPECTLDSDKMIEMEY